MPNYALHETAHSNYSQSELLMFDWLFIQNTWAVYPLLFAMLMGGAIGLPFPEDIPLIAAGVFLHRDVVTFLPAFLVCYLGVIIGDLVLYYFGHKVGSKFINSKKIKRRLHPRRIAKINDKLERHCVSMIIVARHLFYLRSATFILCGASKISFLKFLVVDMIAALFSVTIMMSIGYSASENLPYVLSMVQKAKYASLIATVAIAIGLIFYIYLKNRPNDTNEE